MTNTTSGARRVGFDVLRCLACLMVVLLHAAAQNWYVLSPSDPEWVAMHVWDTATRCAVPIFFMISGALFLAGPPPGVRFWTRNLPRLVSVYIVWSLLYGVDNMTLDGFFADPAGVIDQAMVGHYHLWFLPAMIGVYLLMPVLYAMVHYEDGRALRPYLIVFAVFGIGAGTIAAFDGYLPWALSVGAAKIVPELCGYCGYFILGYVLARAELPWLRRWMTAAVFLVSVTLTAVAGICLSRDAEGPLAFLHGEFTLPTALEAVSLFLFFRTVSVRPDSRAGRMFARLSACTLGVYLLHPFVMEHLLVYGFTTTLIPAWAGVPMVALAVTAVCLAVTAVLRRIPLIGKWIV